MQINACILICELCFHPHRSHLHTDTHLSALFFVCASFLWRLKEQLPPKGRQPRAKSAWLLRRHRRLFMCSADAARLAADVTCCRAAEGASGERLDVWQSTFKLERARKSPLYFQEARGANTGSDVIMEGVRVGCLWFKQSHSFSVYARCFSSLSCCV